MYNVSDEYKKAVAQFDREFKLEVRIYLRDKTILVLGEDDVIPPDTVNSDRYVMGDLKIESQMMSGVKQYDRYRRGAISKA